MGARGSFPGGKADHLPPSSAKVTEYVELSWRGAQLKKKHKDNLTFYIYQNETDTEV
jgi:hypothetical protein